MMGVPSVLARRAASSIDSTAPIVSVPMLRTRACACAVIASTSSGAWAITGDAPIASVALATSFWVTVFVM